MDQAQKNFIKSYIELRLAQGDRVILRTEVAEAWLAHDPQPTYGTQTQFGRKATVFMREIAEELGGHYVKDANNRRARLEF